MFKRALRQFLDGTPLSEEEEKIIIKTIKTQAWYAVNSIGYSTFKEIYSEIDELTNEAIIAVINKRNYIIKVIDNDGNVESYIKFAIKNHIIDKLRKKTIDNCELKEEHKNKIIERNETVNIEAEEFAKACKEALTKTEKEALCFELMESKPPNKSQSSFEKAKSRAHKRIRELIIKEKYSIEVVDIAIKRFFLSEICKEFVNSNEGKK